MFQFKGLHPFKFYKCLEFMGTSSGTFGNPRDVFSKVRKLSLLFPRGLGVISRGNNKHLLLKKFADIVFLP